MELKYIGLRVDRPLYEKFRYVAAYQGDSMNRRLLACIRQCVDAFEREQGEITPEQIIEMCSGK